MTKKISRISIVYSLLMVLYSLILTVVPFYKGSVYWVSYAFTICAFGVAAYSVYSAFAKNYNVRSKFYGFPIAKIGVVYFAAQLIAGLAFTAVGKLVPVWIPLIVYAVAIAAAVIGVVSAETVVEEIQVQDVKLKKNTALMRSLQSQVNQMVSLCHVPENAKAMQEFADELRYSDPVSSSALANEEQNLNAAIDELQQAVTLEESEPVLELIEKATAVLNERNRLCKINKGQEEYEVAEPKAQKVLPAQKTDYKGAAAAIAAVTVLCVVLTVLVNAVFIPNAKYNACVELMAAGQYEDAIAAFEKMDGYKDSEQQIENCYAAITEKQYQDALSLIAAEKYEEAKKALAELGEYKDCPALLEKIMADEEKAKAEEAEAQADAEALNEAETREPEQQLEVTEQAESVESGAASEEDKAESMAAQGESL